MLRMSFMDIYDNRRTNFTSAKSSDFNEDQWWSRHDPILSATTTFLPFMFSSPQNFQTLKLCQRPAFFPCLRNHQLLQSKVADFLPRSFLNVDKSKIQHQHFCVNYLKKDFCTLSDDVLFGTHKKRRAAC